MLSRVRTPMTTTWIAVLCAVCLPGWYSPVFAASYGMELMLTLTAPPAIDNKFGFATFVGTSDQSGPCDSCPQMHGEEAKLTPSLALPRGIGVSGSGGGFATGLPGEPPAESKVFARTESFFNMVNITGTPGCAVCGPPETLTVDLNITAHYVLAATAGINETASAGVQVFVHDMSIINDEIFAPPSTSKPGDVAMAIPVTLLPNRVTPVFLRTTIFGSASSAVPPEEPQMPPPPPPPLMTPEPTTLRLAVTALSVIGAVSRKRKRERGKQTREQAGSSTVGT